MLASYVPDLVLLFTDSSFVLVCMCTRSLAECKVNCVWQVIAAASTAQHSGRRLIPEINHASRLLPNVQVCQCTCHVYQALPHWMLQANISNTSGSSLVQKWWICLWQIYSQRKCAYIVYALATTINSTRNLGTEFINPVLLSFS